FDIAHNDGTTSSVTYNYDTGDTLDDMINDPVDGLNASMPTYTSGTPPTTEPIGEIRLVDGLLVFQSNDMGDSQLDITSATVTAGTGSIDFPNFQITQEGETNMETMSTTVYDDLGEAHSLLIHFTQTGENEW